MKHLLFVSLAALTILFAACNKDDEPSGSSSINCSVKTLSVCSEGEIAKVKISSKATWSATVDKSWVKLSPENGLGDAYVELTIQAGNSDQATVLFSNGNASAELIVKREHPGRLSGKFSVADNNKKVYFSKGNLQYKASLNTWRFAEHQYDTIGARNKTISSTNTDWIDLFGWGTSGWSQSGASGYRPWTTYGNVTLYCVGGTSAPANLTGNYANADWGVYNKISNGGNEAGMWRTLTKDEVTYLIDQRDNAAQRRGAGNIAGLLGFILLPDDWQTPAGLTFVSDPQDWTTNTYTTQQWQTMQTYGAVFLPLAGMRDVGVNIVYTNTSAAYWTVDTEGIDYAYKLWVGKDNNTPNIFWEVSRGTKSYGSSVRLVQDAN